MLSHVDNSVGAKEDDMGEAIDAALKPTVLDKVPWWILPDHISVARAACLTPLMVFGDRPIPAIVILLFSSACDVLDGVLARVRKQKTDEGAANDAMADKIFSHGAMLTVCYDHVHPVFVGGFLAVDLAIATVRAFKRRYQASQDSNKSGKRKTVALTLAIGLVLTNAPPLMVLAPSVFLVALFFALMSFVGHARELRSALAR